MNPDCFGLLIYELVSNRKCTAVQDKLNGSDFQIRFQRARVSDPNTR